jgi:hypothetical protein
MDEAGLRKKIVRETRKVGADLIGCVLSHLGANTTNLSPSIAPTRSGARAKL